MYDKMYLSFFPRDKHKTDLLKKKKKVKLNWFNLHIILFGTEQLTY